MYSQCPQCLTVYRLSPGELVLAHGSVRCAHCETVFDALATLRETLPPEPIESLPMHAAGFMPPRLALPVFRPTPAELEFDPDRDAIPSPAGGSVLPRPDRPERRRRNWPWVLAIALLSTTLVAEAGWVTRSTWLANGTVRRALGPVCARLQCTLPMPHAPGLLELTARDVSPNPALPGALVVSATVRNDAPYTQAFPVVEITLSDLDGHRVAMRRITPGEYLDDPGLLRAGLPSGASTVVSFEVADPGRNAVAFEFRFL